MTVRALTVVTTFMLVVAAVSVATDASAVPDERPALDGTAWTLSSLPGHPLLPDVTVTMRLENGRVNGTDGCNRYNAGYTATPGVFQLSTPIASTRMACPEAVMQQARAFLDALAAARVARVEGAQLVLLDAAGQALAALTAQSREIAGTAWKVTGYNNRSHAVVSLVADTEISIEFSADGKVSGSAGCNTYNGTYSLSAQTLAIGRTVSTRKMCEHPKGVMGQEGAFLKALEMVAIARIDGDRLELRSRDGALAVAAVRSTAATASASSAATALAGEMTYMADAARFTECATGRSYPVAMEADFVDMERAYLQAVKEPGVRLYVTFEGLITDRPKADGESDERTVVVTRFDKAWPGKRCE